MADDMDVDQGAPAQQLDTQLMAISQHTEASVSSEADQSKADSSPVPRPNDGPVDDSEPSLFVAEDEDDHEAGNHNLEDDSDIKMVELIHANLANEGLASETPVEHLAQRDDNILKPDEDTEDSKLKDVNDINEANHEDAETSRNDNEPSEIKDLEDDSVPKKDTEQGHSDDVKDADAPEATEAKESEKKNQKAKGEPRKMARNPKEFFAKHRAKESTRKRKGIDTDNSRASKMLKENSWQDDKSSGVRSMLINGAGEDFERSFGSGDAPSMGTISAKTHKAQFDQIKAQIPPDCDTRRASSQLKDLDEAKKAFGFRRIAAVNGNYLLKGMRTALFPYQMTLVAWMAKRECGDCTPFGGIVGDEMGMGKTVVSLFLIDGNLPSQEEIEDHCHATLVVVPNTAIAKQWQAEAESHSSPATASRTSIFRRSNGVDLESTKEQRIVITTYKEVLSQWIEPAKLQALRVHFGDDKEGLRRELFKLQGPLYAINWYRIILDEAHTIKNIKAQTTQACCLLNAKFRWCLSGTPLANTSEELYPYLSFIGCEFTENLATFREQYIKGHKAQENLEALISMIMYRRTKKDEMLGCKILDVPHCTKQELWVPLSSEEGTFLDSITCHYERAIRSGGSSKTKLEQLTKKEKDDELAALRAMYMMQRQACSHLFNTESWLRNSCSLSHLQFLLEDLNNRGATATLLEQLLKAAPNWLKQFSTGLKELRKLANPTLCGYIDVAGLVSSIANEKRLMRTKCASCPAKPPVSPMFAKNCGHVYCGDCIVQAHKQRASGVKCVISRCKEQLALGDDIATLSGTVAGLVEPEIKKIHETTQDSHKTILRKDKEQNGMFLTSEAAERLHTPPSMKLLATMVIILDWQKNHPKDKIIVFTMFITTAKMLGRMLNIAGINEFLYFFGEVSQPKRDKAIHEFEGDPKKKIMIMGLKCGALGLNLTSANRVIIVDPWWNNTVEQQAFGRVWRYKQKKICHLVRIKSESPMDLKIAEMQASKSKEVDRALQDEGFMPTEIDDHNLRMLFNFEGKKPEEGMTTEQTVDRFVPTQGGQSSEAVQAEATDL